MAAQANPKTRPARRSFRIMCIPLSSSESRDFRTATMLWLRRWAIKAGNPARPRHERAPDHHEAPERPPVALLRVVDPDARRRRDLLARHLAVGLDGDVAAEHEVGSVLAASDRERL